MLYHVIIALNRVGQRKVGPIISVLEKRGLELVEIRKKVSSSNVESLPNLKQLVVQYQLNELDAMEWYRKKFTDLALQKMLNRLFRNHVELFFESEVDLDSHELWETIRTEVFPKDRKFSLMFVIKTSGENGINVPFIPEDFAFDEMNFKFRTLRPNSK
jgi:hypothetical protein